MLVFLNGTENVNDLSWLGMPLHEIQFIRIVQKRLADKISEYDLPPTMPEYRLIMSIDKTALKLLTTVKAFRDPGCNGGIMMEALRTLREKVYNIQVDADLLPSMEWEEWLIAAGRPNLIRLIEGLENGVKLFYT